MAAQLVVIAKKSAGEETGAEAEKQPEKGQKSGSAAAGGASTGGADPYGPYWPIPVGTLNVYGQKPVHIGHFADMGEMLAAVHSRKGLPGGSNTLFASVGNLHNMRTSKVHEQLAALPDQLTIIVHEAKHRA